MSNYTHEQLRDIGTPILLSLLVDSSLETATITYGEFADILKKKMGIDSLYSTATGVPAGHMMSLIWDIDPEAPPLNVLLVRTTGEPGPGADWHLEQWSGRKYGQMNKMNKKALLADAMRAVWAYPHWESLYKEITGADFKPIQTKRENIQSSEYGGVAESDEHKRLKLAITSNPSLVADVSELARAIPEALIKSGDEIDVRIIDTDIEYLVEVKSIRSLEGDLERGLYQCIKYKAVVDAEYTAAHAKSNTVSILVTERELPQRLKRAARTLGIRVKTIKINT